MHLLQYAFLTGPVPSVQYIELFIFDSFGLVSFQRPAHWTFCLPVLRSLPLIRAASDALISTTSNACVLSNVEV